jgi:hypothetical protein
MDWRKFAKIVTSIAAIIGILTNLPELIEVWGPMLPGSEDVARVVPVRRDAAPTDEPPKLTPAAIEPTKLPPSLPFLVPDHLEDVLLQTNQPSHTASLRLRRVLANAGVKVVLTTFTPVPPGHFSFRYSPSYEEWAQQLADSVQSQAFSMIPKLAKDQRHNRLYVIMHYGN